MVILFGCSTILHKHCFQFLLGLKNKLKTMRMLNFGGTKKEYYGKFESCIYSVVAYIISAGTVWKSYDHTKNFTCVLSPKHKLLNAVEACRPRRQLFPAF